MACVALLSDAARSWDSHSERHERRNRAMHLTSTPAERTPSAGEGPWSDDERGAAVIRQSIWKGRYEYEPGTVGTPACFHLELRRLWLVRLVGIVQDDPPGMPEQGRVHGWLIGRRLWFRKQMPVFRIAAEGGTTPLAEWLPSVSPLQVSATARHPPLSYAGTISADGRRAAGTWHLAASQMRLSNDPRCIRLAGCQGTWSAERVE
jgi:hypothetical protein